VIYIHMYVHTYVIVTVRNVDVNVVLACGFLVSKFWHAGFWLDTRSS